jgi:hypothetical protein
MKIYQIKGGRVQNKYIKVKNQENDDKSVSENIPNQIIEVPKNNHEIKIPEKKVRKFISL